MDKQVETIQINEDNQISEWDTIQLSNNQDNEGQLIRKQCEMCWQYTTKWHEHISISGHHCLILEGFKHPSPPPRCLFDSIRGTSIAQNHHNHIVCTPCINKSPKSPDNDTRKFTSWDSNESIIFNDDIEKVQVNYEWPPIDEDWSSNVKNDQISEWGTIQTSNIQDIEDCSWNSETLNVTIGTDQNDDDDKSLKSITTNNEDLYIFNEEFNTKTEKIDPNWFTIYHNNVKPLSRLEKESKYSSKLLPTGDLPKPRNRRDD